MVEWWLILVDSARSMRLQPGAYWPGWAIWRPWIRTVAARSMGEAELLGRGRPCDGIMMVVARSMGEAVCLLAGTTGGAEPCAIEVISQVHRCPCWARQAAREPSHSAPARPAEFTFSTCAIVTTTGSLVRYTFAPDLVLIAAFRATTGHAAGRCVRGRIQHPYRLAE